MKKHLLLVFILFLHFLPAKAQYVTIPDANFVTWLTQEYPSCMIGNQLNTNCSEIIMEDTVIVVNLGIQDLTGIEYFNNLYKLNCSGNQLTNLPQLPYGLQYLNCSNNQLDSLPSLSINLQYINCAFNNLSSLPLLPNSLQKLYCTGNQLVSLPTLPSQLQVLQCGFNQLTSLPVLPNYIYFTTLVCDHNQLTSLPTLPTSLDTLQCQNNQLTNLSTSSNLYLDCSSNQLTSLPQLSNSMRQFNCSNNQITSLPAISSMYQILNFYCSYNQLTSIPQFPSSNFYSFHCSYNLLTSLPLIPNGLRSLVCSNNQLTSIPVLHNSFIQLRCNDNLLTSLPFLPNSLSQLICSNNLLTSIPQLPNIMSNLVIDSNNIYCLVNLPQIAQATNINNANIAGNPLTCVPNQTNYSLGLPLCLDFDPVNNPNNCQGIANITGYVYKDMNSNCIYNNNDLRSENIPVKLHDSQNNFLALSATVNGVYSFTALQPDTFKVIINDSTLLVSIACGQANNQNVSLDSANQTISNINFPLVCDTVYDLNVQSMNAIGMVFPGQVHLLNTNIANNLLWYNLNCNTQNYSGTVSIEVTGPVTFVSPALGALTPQVTGNTFIYNIPDFNSLTPTSFGLNLMTDTTAQAGSQICSHIVINPTPLDVDTTNNTFNYCYQVVNSYDPNMKEVYPVNVLPGYDDWFTYTIHFQNTGNAPAFNIRLRDTLDNNLDLTTFEILGYSHPANVTLHGSILQVRFNNIMLPDSTTDYEGSMGYFQYRIKPLPNLAIGTQIENTAYIYFDFNAPIVTNTTQNNFQLITALKSASNNQSDFLIYPNPSNGIFNFKDTKNLKQVEVYNLLGEQILAQGNQKQINLSGFSKGIYYARINGELVVKLVKD